VTLAVVLGVAAPSNAAAQGDEVNAIFLGPLALSASGPFYPGWVIDVQSGPSGENPSGTLVNITKTAPGHALGPDVVNVFARGEPICLRVEGSRASINSTYDPEASPGGSAFYVTIVVEDAGPGGTDRFMSVPIGSQPAPCPDPAGFQLTPVSQGDINVHDALTREQARLACREERRTLGQEAFRLKYGTPGRAMRNCIKQKMA
jgi:hypothetical protein